MYGHESEMYGAIRHAVCRVWVRCVCVFGALVHWSGGADEQGAVCCKKNLVLSHRYGRLQRVGNGLVTGVTATPPLQNQKTILLEYLQLNNHGPGTELCVQNWVCVCVWKRERDGERECVCVQACVGFLYSIRDVIHD